MIFLVDHNLGGHAEILFGNIASQGWLELLPIRFVTFKEMNLSIDSNDRVVWRFAQANQMILLTANRSMKGEDSLEQVLREENTVDSLPVITIGDADRFLTDRAYRNRCVDCTLEILLNIENWMGVGRLFIP
ncbi:MAG: ACP S-malonyltransferase [Scytonema sp. PMC 1070.18]|nr:ACP S-malonyltransferase [Scytonema sp. PMC 1070.18]